MRMLARCPIAHTEATLEDYAFLSKRTAFALSRPGRCGGTRCRDIAHGVGLEELSRGYPGAGLFFHAGFGRYLLLRIKSLCGDSAIPNANAVMLGESH